MALSLSLEFCYQNRFYYVSFKGERFLPMPSILTGLFDVVQVYIRELAHIIYLMSPTHFLEGTGAPAQGRIY